MITNLGTRARAAVLPRWRISPLGAVCFAIALFWIVIAILGPWIAPHPAGQIVSFDVFGPMTAEFPLGTDYLGRDMLSRILYGARYTVGVAMVATVLACMGGIALGILSAVRQGWTDSVLGRAADALISIPHLMFALVVVAAFGTSLPVLILMAAISYVPGSYRFARALALDINAMDFIEVARARGERAAYVVWAEILPNMIVPLMTDFGLRFVFVVLLLSGLSFLGLGIQPPNADWGALVRENINGIYEAAPAVLVPAVAIAVLTISITLLIDGFSGRGWMRGGAMER
jgi:peptide/nickel transport system permease protein